MAEAAAGEDPRIRVIDGPHLGRGHAIRVGARAASGGLIVTTEIDCSWGDDIVPRLVHAMREHPSADIVIASPHLPHGGYRNVPWRRVVLSAAGNYIIRTGLTYAVTMNTGMTRAYRRERFLALPLDENGKEMHLEVVNKALAFGYEIREIPAVIEWKAHKLARQGAGARASSSSIGRLIRTHLLFSLLASPFRHLYFVSLSLSVAGLVLFLWSVANLFRPEPSIYLLLTALLVWVFSFLVFGIGVLAQQGRMLQREMWRVRHALQLQGMRSGGKPDETPGDRPADGRPRFTKVP